jgi:hypothetical protein
VPKVIYALPFRPTVRSTTVVGLGVFFLALSVLLAQSNKCVAFFVLMKIKVMKFNYYGKAA